MCLHLLNNICNSRKTNKHCAHFIKPLKPPQMQSTQHLWRIRSTLHGFPVWSHLPHKYLPPLVPFIIRNTFLIPSWDLQWTEGRLKIISRLKTPHDETLPPALFHSHLLLTACIPHGPAKHWILPQILLTHTQTWKSGKSFVLTVRISTHVEIHHCVAELPIFTLLYCQLLGQGLQCCFVLHGQDDRIWIRKIIKCCNSKVWTLFRRFLGKLDNYT